MVSVEDGPEVERPVRVRITRLSMGPVRREALRKDMTAVSAARVERAFVLNAALPEEWVEETVPSNGRLWLYGLEARSEYAFSWGPSPGGLLAHRAGVKGDAGAVDLVPRPAVELAGTYRLETGTIPEGATVVAHGDGFEVTALQPEPGKFLVRGVPEEPILLVGRASTADGNEWAGFATAHGGGAPVELVLAPKRGAR
jgi:hypothetical protein